MFLIEIVYGRFCRDFCYTERNNSGAFCHENRNVSNSQQSSMHVFGRRLRARRLALGLSQEALGVAIGIDESCSRTRISRYETGNSEPALAISRSLAKALAVPLGYFYCDDDLDAEALLLIHGMSDDQRCRVVEILRGCAPPMKD